jgi:NADH dehydrogenase [ubiquinone] 1 alpha subcomplex assembly factor 7
VHASNRWRGTRALPDGTKADPPSAAHIIADKIDRDGPIPLGDYMAIANTHYYASKDPLGEEGDFVTAPEISQMFGEIIGIWLADLWLRKGSPDHCHFVELGPGRGTLANDALRSMARFGCTPRVHFVETSPVLKSRQAELHPDAKWHEDIATLPDDGPLLIVANEFFDALPIEQFVAMPDGWCRQMVARDRSRFVAIPSAGAATDQIGGSISGFPQGTVLERSPISVELTGNLANRLAKQGGTLLIIDYGYSRPGTGSTLQAVKDHMPISPFDSPGTSDLTAHVDFHTLANIARPCRTGTVVEVTRNRSSSRSADCGKPASGGRNPGSASTANPCRRDGETFSGNGSDLDRLARARGIYLWPGIGPHQSVSRPTRRLQQPPCWPPCSSLRQQLPAQLQKLFHWLRSVFSQPVDLLSFSQRRR